MRRPTCTPWPAIVTLLAACGTSPPPTQEDTPGIQRKGDRIVVPEGSPLRERLHTNTVKTSQVIDKLVVPASVETDPTTSAKITPPVAGRIVQLFVHIGDSVTQGQPLFSLDAPDLASAQSDYMRAQSALAQAQHTLTRQKDLKEHGIGSDRELEQAQTDFNVAQSELERTTVRLKLLKSDPGQLGKPLTVRAPISGRIVDASVAPGEFRNDPNAVLMTIADLSTIWVTANVQEKDIRRVHAHQAVTAALAAYPGETFSGRVLFVADVLDPDTRTLKARIAIPNDNGRLKPGMFAMVTFASDPVQSLVVPATAVVLLGDRSVVFVEVEPWTFVPRKVEPGSTQGDLLVIVSGVTEGMRIVASDAVLLQ